LVCSWILSHGGGSASSSLPITGVNVPGGAGPVLYTPAWGTTTPPSGGIELVMAASESPGPLNRPVPVTLQGVRVSPGGIPAGGAVIAVPAAAADHQDRGRSAVPRPVVVLVTVVVAVRVPGPVAVPAGTTQFTWDGET